MMRPHGDAPETHEEISDYRLPPEIIYSNCQPEGQQTQLNRPPCYSASTTPAATKFPDVFCCSHLSHLIRIFLQSSCLWFYLVAQGSLPHLPISNPCQPIISPQTLQTSMIIDPVTHKTFIP